jgi:hypothetical protein
MAGKEECAQKQENLAVAARFLIGRRFVGTLGGRLA